MPRPILSPDQCEHISELASYGYAIEDIALYIDVDPDWLQFEIEDEEDSLAAWAYREGRRQKIEHELERNGRKEKRPGPGDNYQGDNDW